MNVEPITMQKKQKKNNNNKKKRPRRGADAGNPTKLDRREVTPRLLLFTLFFLFNSIQFFFLSLIYVICFFRWNMKGHQNNRSPRAIHHSTLISGSLYLPWFSQEVNTRLLLLKQKHSHTNVHLRRDLIISMHDKKKTKRSPSRINSCGFQEIVQ